jgi:hypothetical protein
MSTTTMKTPGVYIQELDAFGNSVVPVATAVPAFIGYTEKTSFNGKSLKNTAVKITSLTQFQSMFEEKEASKRPKIQFNITTDSQAKVLASGASIYIDTPAKSDAMGTNGEYYLDTTAKKVFGPKASNKWPTTGVALISNSGSPAKVYVPGQNGQFYADVKAKNIYGPYKNNAWPSATTTLIGESKPDDQNDGADGDVYVDTKAKKKYGPKKNGKWPAATAVLLGENPPATDSSADGAFYLDNTTNNLYGPKKGGKWPSNGDDISTVAPDFSFNGTGYSISNATRIHRLHSAMRFFYANGGAECYVISVGDYKDPLNADDITGAIDLLKKETEPTMLVVPDVVEFDIDNAYAIQGYMINHCGEEMPNRVAILDIPGGYSEPNDSSTASVDQFRDRVSGTVQKSNSYAVAYYPWLHTTVYQASDISYQNITEDSFVNIAELLTAEFTNTKKGISSVQASAISCFTNKGKSTDGKLTIDVADAALQNLSVQYPILLSKVRRKLNLMAPSAAMAGIYTAVDNSQGVWKAPANVAVQSVIAPAIKIDHDMQEDLNVPLDGKSVCAIRAFKGMGNMVWGARTLDGNSNDWRYVNIRRTLIYLEQSIKEAAKAYVFAPNDASTWVNVQSMIANFLTGVWKQGGLVGPKPADAFSVSVGLGTTMTNDDIQNGRMIVAVKVALSHPAEFIEITFQQEMQKA